jgi:hypothetical protein
MTFVRENEMFSEEMKKGIVSHFEAFVPEEFDDWGVSVDKNLENLGMWFDSYFEAGCPNYYDDACEVAGYELDFSDVREALWTLLEERDEWESFMARLKRIEIDDPMEAYVGFDSATSITIANYLEEVEFREHERLGEIWEKEQREENAKMLSAVEKLKAYKLQKGEEWSETWKEVQYEV